MMCGVFKRDSRLGQDGDRLVKSVLVGSRKLGVVMYVNEVTDEIVRAELMAAMDSDSARIIAEAIIDDVKTDIIETADKEFSFGDLQLAIGRTLVKRLGLEI